MCVCVCASCLVYSTLLLIAASTAASATTSPAIGCATFAADTVVFVYTPAHALFAEDVSVVMVPLAALRVAVLVSLFFVYVTASDLGTGMMIESVDTVHTPATGPETVYELAPARIAMLVKQQQLDWSQPLAEYEPTHTDGSYVIFAFTLEQDAWTVFVSVIVPLVASRVSVCATPPLISVAVFDVGIGKVRVELALPPH